MPLPVQVPDPEYTAVAEKVAEGWGYYSVTHNIPEVGDRLLLVVGYEHVHVRCAWGPSSPVCGFRLLP